MIKKLENLKIFENNINNKKKEFPIKKPYVFDTPEGVDHVTKTLQEDNIEKMTPFKKDQLDKLNREMKLSLLKSEEKSLKKFMNEDPSSYPSDPEQRGKLMNIQALEKSLNIRPDSWKRFVKTGALPLAEKKPDLWKDVIYPSMTIHEKATWNAEKRKKGEDGRTGEKLPIKKVEKKPDDFVLDLEQSVPLPKPTVMPRPPIYPQKPIVNEVKEAPGISEDFVRLQTAIRKNIDYVLGTDQKDRKNTGEDK